MIVHGWLAAPPDPSLPRFGTDPWWLMVGKALAIFVFLVLTTLFAIWAERRLIGRMQQRPGPNRVGPFGLLQSLADGIKLALKEDIVPRNVHKPVYILAPAIAAIPAFVSFSIIPFGPVVSVFGHATPLQLADLPVAVLLVLAMASMGVYGIVLAGWASGSPYPLLGALRSSAQVISYEIAMALSFVAVFLFAGSLSTSTIVAAQQRWWFAVLLFPSFVVYLVTMVGETNRLPFDLPEGEGELVGGFHTEYSSLKFALFFLAEYISVATVSALGVTLFLGGWRAPWPISAVWAGANTGWWPLLWFLAKLLAVMFMFVWLRATLPRVRYDQLMKLGWKLLIPISLVWILFVATVRALRNQQVDVRTIMIVGGIVIAIVFVVTSLLDWMRERRKEEEAAAEAAEAVPEPADGGFPVPPLDAPHYRGVSPAEVGAGTARSVGSAGTGASGEGEITGA